MDEQMGQEHPKMTYNVLIVVLNHTIPVEVSK